MKTRLLLPLLVLLSANFASAGSFFDSEENMRKLEKLKEEEARLIAAGKSAISEYCFEYSLRDRGFKMEWVLIKERLNLTEFDAIRIYTRIKMGMTQREAADDIELISLGEDL